MRIVTRDPLFREMEAWRNAMERMLNEVATTRYEANRPWVLPVDVIETEDKYIVKASIPGINPDDLDITFSDNILTIQGEIADEAEKLEGNYLLRERRFGVFQRSIALPERVEADKIEATYEDGVLVLSIPKVEEIKPKRISVKAK
jgi:HSP20 family protein